MFGRDSPISELPEGFLLHKYTSIGFFWTEIRQTDKNLLVALKILWMDTSSTKGLFWPSKIAELAQQPFFKGISVHTPKNEEMNGYDVMAMSFYLINIVSMTYLLLNKCNVYDLMAKIFYLINTRPMTYLQKLHFLLL